MNIAPLVAQHVAEVVHGNWTEIYLDDAIADVSYQEAITVPAGLVNSIAMLVNHLEFYNFVITERLMGTEPVIDDANGFAISIQNEDDWQLLKQRTLDSFKKLADLVSQLPEETLHGFTPRGKTTFYKTLHGLSEHAHYHLGQIVLLKKLVRAAK